MKTTRDIGTVPRATPPRGAFAEPLPLDLETAPDSPSRSLGYRAYVGGILYIEGFIVLAMGLSLLAMYWPPVAAHGKPANPASKLGLWLCIAAVSYMIVVGFGIFLYNLWKPGTSDDDDPLPARRDAGVLLRMRRYASMKKRTRYIFDSTICCERDAEEAILARNLY